MKIFGTWSHHVFMSISSSFVIFAFLVVNNSKIIFNHIERKDHKAFSFENHAGPVGNTGEGFFDTDTDTDTGTDADGARPESRS
jgi:hypothetical protein